MRNRWIDKLLPAACLSVAVLAGCGGASDPGAAPSAGPIASAPSPAPSNRAAAPVESMTVGSPLAERRVAVLMQRAPAGGSRISLESAGAASAQRALPGEPKTGAPRRIGFGRDIPHTDSAAKTASRLAWRPTPAGGAIGQITFESPGAAALRLGLLVHRLPAEATVRFSAPSSSTFEVSGREILATIQRNREAGDRSPAAATYWSPHVDGSEISFEVELPAGFAPESVQLSVPRLSHLSEHPAAAADPNVPLALGAAASCEVDVNCYAYSTESNAIARMSFVGTDGGSYACTGTLLNDRSASGTPYFLTANHCIATQTSASTLQTYWFYRSTSCNSGLLNPGTRSLARGATLLYASAATDTSFLRLASTPPPGTTYAGWWPDAVALGAAVAGVHHPRADLQKISLGSVIEYAGCRAADLSGAFSCSATTQSAGQFLNVRNTVGTTEGGSSGSALFQTIGSSRYVAGQLYGGNSSCTNVAGSNFYGRFDVAYNAALRQWLDGGSSIMLSVDRSGSGQGTVTSAPSGISCGASCAAGFAAGTSVTLAATPAAGSTFDGWSGACSGTGSCVVSMSAAANVVATFSTPAVALGTPLDNMALPWSTGGNAPFIVQTSVSSFGGSAVQSGAIGNSQSTFLTTGVSGPGVLTFDTKVSSEQGYDFLSVSLDGVKLLSWSGETAWTTSSVAIPAGVHTVKWAYTKDAAVAAGRDAGWVDHVVFVPDASSLDISRLAQWAEFAYPSYFAGTSTSGTYLGYTYRYYPQTGNYLGVRNGRVAVHNGSSWVFLDVGLLADYLVTVSAAGF